MIFKDYYKILELESNKVDVEKIKSAYRELAKKYHPDLHAGNQYAEERFKDINEACAILTNQISKKKYDKIWTSHIGKRKTRIKTHTETPAENTDSDFMTMLFGKQEGKQNEKDIVYHSGPIKGEHIETELKISIHDAFYGIEKKLSFKTTDDKVKLLSIKIPSRIKRWQ